VLRKIFGPEKGKVTEQWRRLQIEKFSDYYRLSDTQCDNYIMRLIIF